ncbi:iron transporter [Allorhizobium sp. BGMRC 0089]|uniref:iron transporter n=1 Tax=Allorhizobium sonneratiae TaxID=2934936 RepID=UPI0020340D20|nr:iron transporter [Allorhizobium sonneratiae]MCM2290708.1 iron transporter [Allorhizobium sonneratiae]
MKRSLVFYAAAVSATILLAENALAEAGPDIPIGGPLHVMNLDISASYTKGAEPVAPKAAMPRGADVVHLKTDIQAAPGNPWGFASGSWVPYLTIDYSLIKKGTHWKSRGHLQPMTAKDGPHYAANIKLDGHGEYTISLIIHAPDAKGLHHETGRTSGVPGFWKPFTESFTFTYPQK